ncbi:hypothetical protein BX661DRAFT_176471 [Kickxella alabastrina]|uniref:uncharacterized protein n=1 Tax=Kickxella alabastrina TaxID=61397 RepID=UPI0022200E9A|nr:uncharacterized protein BX661DRAFT_176471 [Kickxella alabastrina]KAI7834010.1 hypothetical protein BX661DRAFT_176471 [Kickxella alabastrina]
MKLQYILASVVTTFLAASTAYAHISMRTPCVRYTPFCDSCPELPAGQSLDENINAPIGTHESISQPLCKFTTPYGRPAAHWTAGSTIKVDFNPHSAVHGGGHCQFALSYDGGKTFVVIHDELKYCFTGGPSSGNVGSQLEYNIALPADLPSSDRVVFAWAWNNAAGNREFYMNCADVAIHGKQGGAYTGPQLLVANYGLNTPYIPEFNGDYTTGLDLYKDRPIITVTASGYYGNSSALVTPALASAPVSALVSAAPVPPAVYEQSGAGSPPAGTTVHAKVLVSSALASSVALHAPGDTRAYGAGLPTITYAPTHNAQTIIGNVISSQPIDLVSLEYFTDIPIVHSVPAPTASSRYFTVYVPLPTTPGGYKYCESAAMVAPKPVSSAPLYQTRAVAALGPTAYTSRKCITGS